MTQCASSRGLLRGDRFPRAVSVVNKKVLVPDEIRSGDIVVRLRGDAAIANGCHLSLSRTPSGTRIVVPEVARIVPGSPPNTSHSELFEAVLGTIAAARESAALAPTVVGLMVDEKREVFLHDFLFRLVQTLMTLVLQLHADAAMHPNVLAYRPVNGVGAGMHIVRALCRRGYCWAAKADVRSYFPSISLGHVLGALPAVIDVDDGMLNMVAWALRAPIARRADHPAVLAGQVELRSEPLRALYQGAVLSPVLSNIVGCVVFDRPFAAAMSRSAILLRYADDLLVLARSKEAVATALAVLHELARHAGLEMHSDPNKTSPAPVNLRREHVRFLGYQIGRGEVRLPDDTFDEVVAAIAAEDPDDSYSWSTFVDAALRLHLDRPDRVADLLAAADAIGPDHHRQMAAAVAHVRDRIRSRWIAEFQSFADPLLRVAL